jgi:hypothetical protein
MSGGGGGIPWQKAAKVTISPHFPQMQFLITSIPQRLTLWHVKAISETAKPLALSGLAEDASVTLNKSVTSTYEYRTAATLDLKWNEGEKARFGNHLVSCVAVRMQVTFCQWYNLHATKRGNVTGGAGGG